MNFNKERVIILKKIIIIISSISILLLAIVGGWSTYNAMNFEKCYVKITENGEVDAGSTLYNYKLKAYDKKGNEFPVEFFGMKNLRLNAYLCVVVDKPLNNNVNQISKYEEVTAEQLPEKVKEKLNVKQ